MVCAESEALELDGKSGRGLIGSRAFHHPIRTARIVEWKNAALPQFLSSQEICFRIMGIDS
jgi:hypothetical protein